MYLEHVINGCKDVLDCLILGNVLKKAEESLGTLSTLVLQKEIPLVPTSIDEFSDEVVVILSNHLRPVKEIDYNNFK